MQIRPATNQDADAIRTLVFGVLEEYGLRACHEGTDADLVDIEKNYQARGGFFDVLVDDKGRIVGSVGVHPQGDGVCELRKMYLIPELRGQGLGRKLLDRSIVRARELGFSRMELETSSRLTQAIALYQANGFEPFTPPHTALRCDQAWARSL